MKLWLLKPIDPEAKGGPWDPWYDKCFGMVIAAPTKAKARQLAAEKQGDEGDDNNFKRRKRSPWLDIKLTSCVELKATESGVILQEVHRA